MRDMRDKRVLVITPHPDDAESGAGGTIAKWSSLGADIVLVVCTNGDKAGTIGICKSARADQCGVS